MTAIANDLWEIVDPEKGEFSILVDGRERLLGKIEVCDLFRPTGVRVSIGAAVFDIFDPGLHDALLNRAGERVTLECPSMRVAERLIVSENEWIRDNRDFALCEGVHEPSVDAGNFGALVCRKAATTIRIASATSQVLAMRLWLEGIALRLGGPDAAAYLRRSWDEASLRGLSDVGLDQYLWMRPYVKVARIL
jgi:hypothetical protein